MFQPGARLRPKTVHRRCHMARIRSRRRNPNNIPTGGGPSEPSGQTSKQANIFLDTSLSQFIDKMVAVWLQLFHSIVRVPQTRAAAIDFLITNKYKLQRTSQRQVFWGVFVLFAVDTLMNSRSCLIRARLNCCCVVASFCGYHHWPRREKHEMRQ